VRPIFSAGSARGTVENRWPNARRVRGTPANGRKKGAESIRACSAEEGAIA
jgi:hypothetical protein